MSTLIETIPATLPYIKAQADRVERWRPRLPAHGLRVGLVWKGNPRHKNDVQRSLPSFRTLAPLWQVSGISFISLQKDENEATAGVLGCPLIHLGSGLADFGDTAAIVSQLDLVITVDTATAHLSGALGRPTWILLPAYRTDWRWFRERQDSPWYPGVVKLFRQPVPGGWEPVIEKVGTELAKIVAIE